MKLSTTHEITIEDGIPVYRWIVKDKNRATVLSTRTREEARDWVRETKKLYAEQVS